MELVRITPGEQTGECTSNRSSVVGEEIAYSLIKLSRGLKLDTIF